MEFIAGCFIGVFCQGVSPWCCANSNDCQTPSFPGGVHYVPAKKCTIKCSSMKSGVFLIVHSPLKGEGAIKVFYLYPNCGPMHKQPPMDNCCHPLDEEA